MDGIGTTGNFSNRAYRSVKHNGIAGPDAEVAKVVREFLGRVQSKLPRWEFV